MPSVLHRFRDAAQVPSARLALLLALLFPGLAVARRVDAQPAGTRVVCYSTFDEDYFYFAALVLKPLVVGSQATPFSEPLKDDCVALFLQQETTGAATARTEHSVEMVVSAAGGGQIYRGAAGTPAINTDPFIKTKEGVPIPFKYRHGLRARLGVPGGADNGFIVEMAIPWVEIGGAPKVGQIMRFNVVAYNAAGGGAPFVSLSPAVKTADDVQKPALWQEIIFVDAPVKSVASAPEARVSARVFTNKPLVDGTISEGEWNTLTSFGFAEAPTGSGSTRFTPGATAPRFRPNVPAHRAPPAVRVAEPSPGPVPPRSPQAVPRLIMTRYSYDVQNDPRKAAPLASVRRENGASLLATHPMDGEGPWMSYDRVDWHRGNLQEMRRAGIDAILPVYRADARSRVRYARRGLMTLASALQWLRNAGRDYPLVGMFLDTSSLADGGPADLREETGKAKLYSSIREFFRLVPPEFRLAISLDPKNGGGRANLVVLSAAQPLAGIDASFMDYCRAHFRADFGADLIVLGSSDFKAAKLDGYINDTHGRGFQMDESGWIKPAAVGALRAEGEPAREPDQIYRDRWKRALDKHADWIVIDGWNDYAIGGEIAPTLERGVELSDVTRIFSRMHASPAPLQTELISCDLPDTLLGGATYTATLRVANAGLMPWAADGHAVRYRLMRGSSAVANGHIAIPVETPPGEALNLKLTLQVPAQAGEYSLSLDAVPVTKKGEPVPQPKGLAEKPSILGLHVASATGVPAYAATVTVNDLPQTVEAGGVYSAHLTLRNDGAQTWKKASGARITARLFRRSPGPADESVEMVEIADATAQVTDDVPPGRETSVTIPVIFGQPDGAQLQVWTQADEWTYEVRWEVSADAAGTAGTLTRPEPVAVVDADVGAVFTADLTPAQLPGERRVPVRLSLRNFGPQGWRRELTRVGYHWYYQDGIEAVWEDETTPISVDVQPGGEVNDTLVWVTAPPNDGRYWLVWDLKVGDTWASTLPSARVGETHVIPVDVVHGRLSFVDLTRAYNLDGIGAYSERADASFDGAGRSFPAELSPPFATTDVAASTLWLPSIGVGLDSSRRIAFKWGPKGPKEKNVVQCVGQKIEVPNAGRGEPIKALYLLAASTRADVTAGFTLNFTDGTQQYASFPFSSWDGPPLRGEEVAFATPFTYTTGGEGIGKPGLLYRYSIKIPEARKLASIQLPNAPEIKIAAITGEK